MMMEIIAINRRQHCCRFDKGYRSYVGGVYELFWWLPCLKPVYMGQAISHEHFW